MVVSRVERADVHGRRDERPGTGTDGDGSTASANTRVSLAARDSRRRSLRPGVGQGDRGSRRYRVRLGFANVRTGQSLFRGFIHSPDAVVGPSGGASIAPNPDHAPHFAFRNASTIGTSQDVRDVTCMWSVPGSTASVSNPLATARRAISMQGVI